MNEQKQGATQTPTPEMKEALMEYRRVITEHGYDAGAPVIEKYRQQFPQFENWACAIATGLRLEELLEETKHKKTRGHLLRYVFKRVWCRVRWHKLTRSPGGGKWCPRCVWVAGPGGERRYPTEEV